MTTRTAALGGYLLALALVHVPLLRALYGHSRGDETASHVVLIPLVTLFLVFQNRQAIFATVGTGRWTGAAVLGAGLAMAIAARQWREAFTPTDALAFEVAALVVLALGGFLVAYGWAAFRAARFPLLFLFFMMPFPSFVLDTFVFLLRAGSADMVGGLFTMSGTPYYREGYVFALPSVLIEVADECSGIRSSIALVLTSLLAGHMCLDSWWRKVVLVAVALPLTILKNGIRIVTLSLLAVHVDPGFLTGQLHHDGGVFFFLLTLLMMAPVLTLLRRSQPAVGGAA